jgi:ABC-type dipeptide/oligopeptide/nickel transport system permease component
MSTRERRGSAPRDGAAEPAAGFQGPPADGGLSIDKLAQAFAAMMGPGVVNITLAVAVIYIPTYYRLVRGQTISIREEIYVEAAQVLGAKRWTILGR